MVVAFIEGSVGLKRFDMVIVNAKEDDNITELAFICVPFREETVEQVVDLLQRRKWKSVLISNCTGDMELMLHALFQEHVEELEIRSLAKLDDTVGWAIGNGLSSNNSLKKLTLSIVTLSNEAVTAMNKGMIKTPNLESIRLSCCTIKENALGSVSEFLGRASRLQAIKVDSCKLGDKQVASLIKAIQFHPQLAQVLVSYNKCGSSTMSTISELLLAEHCKLSTLDIGRQYDEDRYMDLGPFISALRKNESLRSLDLSYSNIRSSDMIALASTLKETSKLEKLYLCGNKLSVESIRAIASVLPRNRRLKRLWLTGNQNFDQKRAEELLKGLRDNMTLEDIMLPQWLPEYSREIEYYMDINKGGRKLFRVPSVPGSVWPHVLERANRMKMDECESLEDSDVRRANILYHLLRGRILLEASS
jgi:Ran GTPase-activating protein (RanGAP) involved in mRNA processing and transport